MCVTPFLQQPMQREAETKPQITSEDIKPPNKKPKVGKAYARDVDVNRDDHSFSIKGGSYPD